jgi:hypothetical protein
MRLCQVERSPLVIAATKGHTDIVELLLNTVTGREERLYDEAQVIQAALVAAGNGRHAEVAFLLAKVRWF